MVKAQPLVLLTQESVLQVLVKLEQLVATLVSEVREPVDGEPLERLVQPFETDAELV